MNRTIALLTYCLIIVAGCEFYPQDDYEKYYVVESYLVANRALPKVRLSHTMPIDKEYSLKKSAVTDADVEIRLLDQNGEIERVYGYSHHWDGIYWPHRKVKAAVKPERRYELKVTIPGASNEITARTLVPGSFQTVEAVTDTVVYQSEQQIQITTTPSSYPGRQSYFIFTVNAIDPSREDLTPFYQDQISENDEDLSRYHINSSRIINEGNYVINDDSTLTLRVPWLAIAFYGLNDVTANALDDNLYDFLRSQSVQGGGSTLPPGEIQNIRYNVEGGIGIFGSMASDTVRVYVRPQ